MTIAQADESTPPIRLRLWPGVVAVMLLWLVRFGLKLVVPGFKGFRLGMMGGLLGALAVLVWWVFFSRARWSERLGAVVLMIAALFATFTINHESMKLLWVIGYGIPVLCLAFVVWAAASRRLPDRARHVTMVATILLASGVWTAVRTEGITGNHVSVFAWRWTATAEDRLLVHASDKPTAIVSVPAPVKTPAEPPVPRSGHESTAHEPAPVAAKTRTATEITTGLTPGLTTQAGWPGFRGPHRDSIIPGARIETNWSASPPVELWRRPIGPGWSSFAVNGDFLYTQEQRGNEELVACYKVSTGEPVWRHGDAARFFESNGGAGPRATPSLRGGRVYTFGATGILNALGAADGAVLWSRNVAADTGKQVPDWGFSSSPLVVDDMVVVAAAGQLAAYDLASGAKRWLGPKGGDGYSSPQRVTIDGIPQVVLVRAGGVTSVAPVNGTLLWEHRWPGYGIVQPALTSDGDVLLGGGETMGMRRIALAHGPGGWTVEERWTSAALKPYFNDFVVHNGHAFGFDGRILACIDLKDGTRKWKGGRYGNGQLVLLRDQNLLLVLSEEGELALVAAVADQFTELARVAAIEGKTWNHPVLVDDVLLVRNGQEMVAFRLSPAHR